MRCCINKAKLDRSKEEPEVEILKSCEFERRSTSIRVNITAVTSNDLQSIADVLWTGKHTFGIQ